MSLEQQADFKITTSWQDNSTQPMISSLEKTNLAWKRVRDETKAVQRQFEVNNRTLVATQRVFHTVNSVLRTGMQIYQTYTLMQIRAQDATRNLADSTKNLNDTIAEFGFNSKEAHDVLQQQKKDAEDLAKTNTDNLVGSIWLVVTAISAVFTAATSAIPRVKQLLSLGRKIIPSKAPIETTVPSKAPIETTVPSAKGRGLDAKIGRSVGIGTGISSGVLSAAFYLAQLMGEQNASAPTSADSPDVISESGFENLKKVAGDIYITINNMINSPTPDQMNTDITNSTQRALAFKAN